ncbi:MFS transporter [Amycolatopsis sp. NPDC059021]|uniref:MFS transporter n=1 Tax=Amycolatopsis sp. NPDC059021 TaxID=3346704 RepID=UPI0036705351
MSRANWPLVAVAGLVSFIAMLDMNIVNVALADVARDLRTTTETAQWTVLGYQLPVVALLLPAGAWLNTAPVRTVLPAAVSGFGLCGLLAAASPWPAWLIAARIAQGVFGAALFVLMPMVAAQAVPARLRGRAMSVPATLGPLGAVLGPAIGGPLIDTFGWRAVFLVKIPVCLAALVLTTRYAERGGRFVRPDAESLRGAALATAGIALFLLGLTFGATEPGWLLLCLAGIPPLALWSRSSGRPSWAVIRDSGTSGVQAAVLALAMAFAVMNYLVGLRMQEIDGISAAVTGWTLLAFAAGMGVAGPLGGRLADRFGPRPVAVAGATLTAAGLLSLLTLSPQWTPVAVAIRLAVAGIGMGLYGGPAQLLVITAAPPERMATAGATVQLARSLGFTLGPACATAAWAFGSPEAGLWLAALVACAAVALLAVRPRKLVPKNGK